MESLKLTPHLAAHYAALDTDGSGALEVPEVSALEENNLAALFRSAVGDSQGDGAKRGRFFDAVLSARFSLRVPLDVPALNTLLKAFEESDSRYGFLRRALPLPKPLLSDTNNNGALELEEVGGMKAGHPDFPALRELIAEGMEREHTYLTARFLLQAVSHEARWILKQELLRHFGRRGKAAGLRRFLEDIEERDLFYTLGALLMTGGEEEQLRIRGVLEAMSPEQKEAFHHWVGENARVLPFPADTDHLFRDIEAEREMEERLMLSVRPVLVRFCAEDFVACRMSRPYWDSLRAQFFPRVAFETLHPGFYEGLVAKYRKPFAYSGTESLFPYYTLFHHGRYYGFGSMVDNTLRVSLDQFLNEAENPPVRTSSRDSRP